MKINFTRKEFLHLLQTLEIADWVVGFHPEGLDEAPSLWNLHQRILSHAKEMGWERLVDLSEDGKVYDFSPEYEEEHSLQHLVQEYENEFFWINLVDRLAERDLVAEIGLEEYYNLDPAERSRRIGDIADKWSAEFDRSGLNNLVLKLSPARAYPNSGSGPPAED